MIGNLIPPSKDSDLDKSPLFDTRCYFLRLVFFLEIDDRPKNISNFTRYHDFLNESDKG